MEKDRILEYERISVIPVVVPRPLPTDEQLDTMTDAEAEEWLGRLFMESPEMVEAVTTVALLASPLAGPVRLLREVIAIRSK